MRQNLEKVNELLHAPGCTGMNGYSLGVVCVLAERDDVRAPDSLLEAAAEVETVAAAVELYRSWAEQHITQFV